MRKRSSLVRLALAGATCLAIAPTFAGQISSQVVGDKHFGGIDLRQHLVVAALDFLDEDIATLAGSPSGTIAVLDENVFLETEYNPRTAMHVQELLKGGVTVYGYVSTRGGEVPLSTLFNNIDKWLNWYGVLNIFFDEGSQFPDQEEYYLAARDYVKVKTGNTMINMSDVMQYEGAMGLADITLVAEATCHDFLGHQDSGGYHRWHQPSWLGDYEPSRISMTIHTCSPDDLESAVRLSKYRGSGGAYVYDGTSMGYDHLPVYWYEEVALVTGKKSDDVTFPRPLLSTLIYPFEGDVIDPSMWYVSVTNSAMATEGSGELVLTLSPTTEGRRSTALVTTWDPYYRVDSEVSVEVREFVGPMANNRFTVLQNGPLTQQIYQVWWQYEGGNLGARYQVQGGAEQTVGEFIPHNPQEAIWLKIRFESESGMVFWDTSSDGKVWTPQRNLPDPLTERTSVLVEFSASTFGPQSPMPGRARYANLNVVPSIAKQTSSTKPSSSDGPARP